MRQLFSVPVANKSLTFYLPKGQFGNIMVEYDVTTSAGNTMTKADAGNIRLNWNGQDIVNADAEILNELNNVYGGTAEAAFVEAGANRMCVIIPSGLYFDTGNVFDIGDNDKVYIKLDFSDLSAKSASGMVTVYAKPKLGQMNYLHHIEPRFVVAQGASTLSDTFPVSNVSQVYFKNPAGANVSQVQINKNSETVIDGSVKMLKAYSAYVHLLETALTTIAIDFGESKDIRENFGQQISYKLTFTGAGTCPMYISFIELTPDKAVESKTRASYQIANNIQK
jgi:hypothetical protein